MELEKPKRRRKKFNEYGDEIKEDYEEDDFYSGESGDD
jgi:hypothetical protein